MKKSVFVFIVVVAFILTSCGKSTSSLEVTSQSEKVNQEEINEEVEESTEEIVDARPFSGGLAWIQLANSEEWQCINENGNVVFELECDDVSEFKNGYAVVDNSIIIDSEGVELYDFGSEGYELVDDQPLDVGCVILEKEMDTYEKSGRFSYVLDIVEKKVTELNFSDCAYFTASNNWGAFYRKSNYKVKLCDYLGKGYYSLKLSDWEFSSSFRMIQWYDVKNNKYINIDSGNEYKDEHLPDTTIYYKTSNPNEICAYIVHMNKIYFINTESCSVEKIVNGYIACVGYDYNLVGVFPEEHLILCYDNRDKESSWLLDMDSREIFSIDPEFEEYEIISYNGDYLSVSLVNDIGTHYLAVIDKKGTTVYDPVAYDFEKKFKPCFFGDNFIYYDGEKMCFVNMSSWDIENQIPMTIETDDNVKENMCLLDSNSEDVKYFVNFYDGSYYLSNGEETSVGIGKHPNVISPGVFENKLLVWDYDSQSYQFLNNDLTLFSINYK